MIFLTKSTTPVIGWVASILGYIMDFLFRFLGNFGIQNIGLCIILFTIIVNIIMLPLTIKQQKSTRMMSFIQPEIQAIQKKYKGKTDQTSQQRMQAETQAVYEKYGTSMTGGCVQLIIQLPILFALYQVIYRIPAYVPTVRSYFEPIAQGIMQDSGYIEKITELAAAVKMAVTNNDYTLINKVIDFLYKLNPAQWQTLQGMFPNVTEITANSAAIERMNTFLSINLSTAPFQGFKPSWAWLIPILAGVTQWLSTKLMMTPQQKPADGDNPMGQTMNSMNTMMPLMSVVFCFTLPAGIGIYWIASAVVRTVEQYFINKHFAKIDPKELIEQNLEKVNAKRAKKGLPPKTVDQKAVAQAQREERMQQFQEAKDEERRERSAKQVIDSNKYYNLNAKEGSLTARANMVAMYDEREWERRTGKKRRNAENRPSEDKAAEDPAAQDRTEMTENESPAETVTENKET